MVAVVFHSQENGMVTVLEGEGRAVGVSEEARPRRQEKAHRVTDSRQEVRRVAKEVTVATESAP